jgi:hypothetical protein
MTMDVSQKKNKMVLVSAFIYLVVYFKNIKHLKYKKKRMMMVAIPKKTSNPTLIDVYTDPNYRSSDYKGSRNEI